MDRRARAVQQQMATDVAFSEVLEALADATPGGARIESLSVDLPPGARIGVRRGERPVRLVRLHEAPFTDRLVAKFGLPVEGWRGSAERRRRSEAP